MVTYADTSFLFSLYGNDSNSAKAHLLGNSLTEPLAFTPLQRHELRNALRLAMFRGLMNLEQCEATFNQIEMDTQLGILQECAILWGDAYSQAEMLSAKYTKAIGTRGFDILHVACAVTLGVKIFLSFDTRQKSLAIKARLTVNE